MKAEYKDTIMLHVFLLLLYFQMSLFDGVNLTFTENHATKNGGAVKVITSPLFNNINTVFRGLNTSGCFFTHAGKLISQDANVRIDTCCLRT